MKQLFNPKLCEWCGYRKAQFVSTYQECGSFPRRIKLCYFCYKRYAS